MSDGLFAVTQGRLKFIFIPAESGHLFTVVTCGYKDCKTSARLIGPRDLRQQRKADGRVGLAANPHAPPACGSKVIRSHHSTTYFQPLDKLRFGRQFDFTTGANGSIGSQGIKDDYQSLRLPPPRFPMPHPSSTLQGWHKSLIAANSCLYGCFITLKSPCWDVCH
jgi:hypothetical protein